MRKEYRFEEPGPEVMEAVRAAAPEGSISCALARKLAHDLGVPPQVIGRAADLLKIKVKNCELGCF
ncbi:MAG: hypothetical protein ACOYW8_03205 [Bacillota bacterium]